MNPSVQRERLPEHPGIVFMGTPEFAVPTLKALVEHGHRVFTVVTQPDRPKGRGKKASPSPVKIYGLEKKLEVLQPEKVSDPAFCDTIREKRPDLIVVVAFGQILRKRLLEIPSWGVLNIHASLLPAYRGAAPITWAIINEEPKTGLTVMHMDEGLDTGPILFQEEVPIGEDETGGALQDRLSQMAGELLVRSLSRMAAEDVRVRPQDSSLTTYAPKIEREMCLIAWRESGRKISARIRALDPRPGAFTTLQGKEIRFFSPKAVAGGDDGSVPGQVLRAGKGLVVAAGEGAVEIGEVQLAGKKRMVAADFLRGFSISEGTMLGE